MRIRVRFRGSKTPENQPPEKKFAHARKFEGKVGRGCPVSRLKNHTPVRRGRGTETGPSGIRQEGPQFILSPVEDYEYKTEHRRGGFIIGNRRFSFRFQGSETDILTDNERERLRNREESGHLRSETRKTMSFFIKNHAFFAENHAFFAIKKDRKSRPE